MKRTLVVNKTLSWVFQRQMQRYFDGIKHQQVREDGQIAAILAFRNLCYKYNE